MLPARLCTRHVLLIALATLGLINSVAAETLERVLETGALRVGVSLFTPWTMQDRSDELIGFEVDVARKLAADLGVTPVLKVYPWAELMAALEGGDIDIVAAGMSITPARALRVHFSQPYAEGGVSLATNTARTAKVQGLDDLNSSRYRIAAIKGTVAEELARRIFNQAKLELFEEADQAADALLAGDVDAYLEDAPVPQFLALENPEVVDVPLAKPLLVTRTAFAVPKGSLEFLVYLNAWITAREADTWLPSSHNYWFNSLRWREQFED
jgi:polar amino acid transport system substrate-binding protein